MRIWIWILTKRNIQPFRSFTDVSFYFYFLLTLSLSFIFVSFEFTFFPLYLSFPVFLKIFLYFLAFLLLFFPIKSYIHKCTSISFAPPRPAPFNFSYIPEMTVNHPPPVPVFTCPLVLVQMSVFRNLSPDVSPLNL